MGGPTESVFHICFCLPLFTPFPLFNFALILIFLDFLLIRIGVKNWHNKILQFFFNAILPGAAKIFFAVFRIFYFFHTSDKMVPIWRSEIKAIFLRWSLLQIIESRHKTSGISKTSLESL